MRAVRKHTNCKRVLLYIQRWLKASIQEADGTLVKREKGTPQGGVISPLLANLFLHYAFDRWMQINQPSILFERYADDIICHCKSEAQAKWLWDQIKKRFTKCRLELHPQKTKIVYCKDDDRRGQYPNESFDFLGYTFRPRLSKNRWGKCFVNFSPAISQKASKSIRHTMKSWKLHLRSDKEIDDLARMFNSVIQGWINYFSQYYKSALYPVLRHLDSRIARWAMRKYRRLKGHRRRARQWVQRLANQQPHLFAHWRFLKSAGQ
jgi:RNA-directed DNA polymerase